ncbi:G-type lectin S-receptor-like serine/threonine-protein kinase LECRK3 [Phoenix dactylifera]|uniref:Receptor-like serine/threonine-protein kinase n=1 Tax=Phoenix dactylifera TaxID=42345 RepID=A0A8B7BXF4_PHODC|nr:G-type lectin S-receptor-like serine/threonine-protein kinase LECRK3 [Phoenix dactylifera]
MAMGATLPLSRHLVSLVALLALSQAFSATAQTYTNVTQGTILTPLGSTNSWPSPSGDFAFGFRALDSNASLFLLAIWYNSTSPQAIVWFANGHNPVLAGSKLELTSDGQFFLTDQSGNEVWNPGVSNASYAALLDSGNLILVSSSSSSPLWQSFASPNDTLLPGQTLLPGSSLRSRLTDLDYSEGRFELLDQKDGNLVLYPSAMPAGNLYKAYWATGTVDSGSNSRLVFNESGSLYLALTNGTQMAIFSNGTYSTNDYYQRATLDPDGVFTLYVYPKSASNGQQEWQVAGTTPPNICTAIMNDYGSGACGYNSYCVSNGDSGKPDCLCPPNYSFIDSTRKYLGCMPSFAPQSCERNQTDSFEFQPLAQIDWPLSDYELYTTVDEDQCKEYCLSDCMCAVTIFKNGDCYKKKLPLSNGRKTSSFPGTALIKVAKSNPSTPQPPGSTAAVEKKDRKTLILVGSLLLGSSGLLNMVFLAVISVNALCRYGNRRPIKPESSVPGMNMRVFTYGELEQATNGFSEELGSGSFGRVYRGSLTLDSRTWIAVKKLDRLLHENDKEFMNEVRSIGQTHHKNLVRLLGLCNEGVHRLLVYEYMSNGSLKSFLFASERPHWNRRTKIALGIARGVLYLHEECSAPIIHCDIKPENILLDDNFVARISDFGLAKLLRTDRSHRTNTGIRGTRGYVAPEWFKNAPITAKVDVYSFGVVLLEIICCRKSLERGVGNEVVMVLTYWACDCYREGRLDLLVEKDEEAMADMSVVERFVMVAIWCIQEEPSLRPSMQKVIQMLEGAVAVPAPPDPSSYISSIR